MLDQPRTWKQVWRCLLWTSFSSVKFSEVGAALLAFLEVLGRGSGTVNAEYAGWLRPRDHREVAILDAAAAEPVRLAGWVRDDVADLIAEAISGCASAKVRVRCAELARYYVRPLDSKHPVASRATLSNWRRSAADYLARELRAPNPSPLTLESPGLPRKGERLNQDSILRDPALQWIYQLDPQERDVAIHRALADAAAEARAKGDARAVIGVAVIAARLAPETNQVPERDYDGTPLRGRDGRKFTRSRLALPLVLMCLHRSALHARQLGNTDARYVLAAGHRLAEFGAEPITAIGPLTKLDAEKTFDRDVLAEGIAFAWEKVSTNEAKPILAALTRHAALAAGMIDDHQLQDLALLSMAVARRQSDRRALGIELHHPTFRNDSAESVAFQLRFRRERLMLASHFEPGRDWHAELGGMRDLLAVRRRILAADDARHLEKVYLHLEQGIHLRQAREIAAAGQPMDIAPDSLTDERIAGAAHAVELLIASLRQSFAIAEDDADETTLVNAHRRKTEAEGVVHFLSRVRHPGALAHARRLQRDLNRLDDLYFDEHTNLRSDVAVLWLLATADQAVRRNEIEQARHYLAGATTALPEGIPHLAIRSANLAVTVGELPLAKRLVDRLPQQRSWPSYLRHLTGRLQAIEKPAPS